MQTLKPVNFLFLIFITIGSIHKSTTSRVNLQCKLPSCDQESNDESVCEIESTTITSNHDDIHFTSDGHDLYDKTTIKFTNCSMELIPTVLFHCMPNLQYLHMVSTNVTAIPQGTFHEAHNLKEINLSDNKIEQLHKNAFEGAPNVYRLNLRNNRIRKISENAFIGLEKLRDLNLAGNSMKDIELVYRKLSKLQGNLVLSNNSIGIIHDFAAVPKIKENDPFQMTLHYMETFAIGHNPLLRSLNVSGRIRNLFMDGCGFDTLYINDGIQKISAIGNNVSKISVFGCDRLETLQLSNNSLSRLDELGSCPKLWFIDLAYNKIIELVPEVMKLLWRVSILNLNGNQLKKIESGMFPENSFLNTLHLEHNQLESFSWEAMGNLRYLRSLFLNDNKLLKLEGVAEIPKFHRLEVISLRNNEWDCGELQNVMDKLLGKVNMNLDNDLNAGNATQNLEMVAGIRCVSDPRIDVRFI